MGRAVTPLPKGCVGSNPTSPTISRAERAPASRARSALSVLDYQGFLWYTGFAENKSDREHKICPVKLADLRRDSARFAPSPPGGNERRRKAR